MKRIIAILMLALTGMTAMAQTSVWDGTRAIWTRGTGTETDPFLIESAQNLAFLAYSVGKGFNTYGLHFRLTTDIDLNGSEDQPWIPIGGQGFNGYNEDGCARSEPSYGFVDDYTDFYFKGHFDGGDHSISNIYVNKETGRAGLFGSSQGIGSGPDGTPAVIENVFVTSGYIKGGNSGGIVGNGDNTIISRCWNGATIEGSSVGGIVGWSVYKVYNCYNVGDVNGTSSAGGIVGAYRAYEIIECYNEGNVTGLSAGGIIGRWQGSGIISNCYNTGTITAVGQTSAGGLVGITAQGTHSISHCYSIGAVQSDNNLGCLIGYGNAEVENCYYLTSTCTESEYGEPKDEDYMRSQEFVDMLNSRNREQVWGMDVDNINDGFPILVEDNLAVSEASEAAFQVYPNPAKGRFTVEGTGTMIVTNTLGQTILTRTIDGQTTIELPQGMYFVRLGGATRKVVVE